MLRIGREKMSATLYPALKAMLAEGSIDRAGADNAIASCAEGYSFPTNLDRDPPKGDLAPKTQAALFGEALDAGWPADRFKTELALQAEKKLT